MSIRMTTGRDKNRLGRSTTKTTAPSTLNGALLSFQRQRVKALCKTCQSVQDISAVIEIIQSESTASYTVQLSCGCIRTLDILVKRTASQLARFKGIDTAAEKQVVEDFTSSELSETDQFIDAEITAEQATAGDANG